MAVAFVADNEYAISSANSQVVTIPTGWAAGDLLVVIAQHGYAASTATRNLPGWRFHGDTAVMGAVGLWSRIAEAGDTTWTWTFDNTWSGAIWIGCYNAAKIMVAAAQPTGLTTVNPPVYTGGVQDGVLINALCTRRDAATGTVIATPGWGTERASIDGTNGSTRHMEMKVMEVDVTGWYTGSGNWGTTNAASYNQVNAVIWIEDDAATGGQYDTMLDTTGPSSPLTGWMYKGRATAADDTTGVP